MSISGNIIITIDGPAGVGKSTVSQMLAKRLGVSFLDTGAMYRALTLAAMNEKADLNKTEQLLDILKRKVLHFDISGGVMKVSIDGMDVSEEIREPSVTANVRYIAEKPELRKELVQMQRDFARQHGGIVTEGRDQGTAVFPDADFKFFLTAAAEERARRRQAQLGESGKEADLEELRENIEKRDASDKNRTVGPLTPADDAIVIDTTNMEVQQAVEKIAEYIK